MTFRSNISHNCLSIYLFNIYPTYIKYSLKKMERNFPEITGLLMHVDSINLKEFQSYEGKVVLNKKWFVLYFKA